MTEPAGRRWRTKKAAKGTQAENNDNYTTTLFKAKSNLKTHDLEGLLEFTAIQSRVKLNHFGDWAIVNKWKPEQRHSPPGTKTLTEATDMIQATQNLLKVLL